MSHSLHATSTLLSDLRHLEPPFSNLWLTVPSAGFGYGLLSISVFCLNHSVPSSWFLTFSLAFLHIAAQVAV